MNRIFSLILSIVMSVVSLAPQGFAEGLKTIFNNTFSVISERSDFLEDIGNDDISKFNENSGYVKNIALIFFEEDASFFEKADALRSVDGRAIGSLPEANLCVIGTKNKSLEELTELCNEAQKHEAVALASICPAQKFEEQYTPNDPFVPDWREHVWDESNPEGNNWWLEAIEARSALGYKSYFNHINIGVIDTGIMTTHEDLQGKVIFPSQSEANKNKERSHGTHVAGIIGALGDNETGIYGLCQNSTLIGVNWDAGWIEAVSILFSVGKVVKAGAKVVNMSLGSSGALSDDEWYWMNFLNDLEGMIFSYYMGSLLNSGYDFVVVQSSGNGNGTGNAIDSGQNGAFCCVNDKTVRAPLGLNKQEISDRIIIVGACYYENGSYIQSDFSNVGKNVDISAPGNYIMSLCSTGYTAYSGTSMATPIVSATASLVWSINEEFSGSDVKKIVCENTKHTAVPNEYYKFREHLDLTDLPVVNAKLAVEEAMKRSFDMGEVSIEANADADIIFKNINTEKELIFEADKNGKLNCLLEKGSYTVTVNGEVREKIEI